MSVSSTLLPIFVDFEKDNKTHRVAVIQFSNTLEEALILFEKRFMKVKIEDLRFAKWDL